MKTTILALLALGLCAPVFAADSLVTTDGTHYDNITYQRVDPDGLYIEYKIPWKGIGMAKVKFNRLTEDQRKEFGIDPARAKDFEAQVAKANEEWRANAQKSEQQALTLRATREAQAIEQESATTQRILAMAQLKQAEADLARAAGGGGNGGYGYDSGGWVGVALPTFNNRPVSDRTFAPIVTPVPFPQQHTTQSTFRGTTPSPFHFSR